MTWLKKRDQNWIDQTANGLISVSSKAYRAAKGAGVGYNSPASIRFEVEQEARRWNELVEKIEQESDIYKQAALYGWYRPGIAGPMAVGLQYLKKCGYSLEQLSYDKLKDAVNNDN